MRLRKFKSFETVHLGHGRLATRDPRPEPDFVEMAPDGGVGDRLSCASSPHGRDLCRAEPTIAILSDQCAKQGSRGGVGGRGLPGRDGASFAELLQHVINRSFAAA